MLQKERSIAVGKMLGMWRGRASSMDVSQKGGMLRTGKGTAKKVGVQGV